jgi:deoxycytidylate deaminase
MKKKVNSRACGHNSVNPSKHAEQLLIKQLVLKDLTGKKAPQTICSLRMIKKNGEISYGPSMPCTNCARLISFTGIKNVIYCNSDGEIVKDNIQNILSASNYSGGTRRKSSKSYLKDIQIN